MKKWILKAIVQKTISFLPLGHQINYFFQKYVTKGVYLTDAYFFDRLGHAKEHLLSYRKFASNLTPEYSLEIGTGWYPIVPVCFFLAGTRKIYSVDITLLTSKERLKITLKKFMACYQSGQLGNYINIIPERLAVIDNMLRQYNTYNLNEVLQQLNINYLIEDARNLSLPDNTIDLVNSNNTFEHIYPNLLIPILKEFRRVVKKEGGVMSHFIDMSDHFAHFDKSITIYNYLQFTDKQWSWIDNSIQPQNRMRIYDYQKIYADLGIPVSEETYRPGNLEELAQVPLAEKFANYPATEVAKSHCYFISDMNSTR